MLKKKKISKAELIYSIKHFIMALPFHFLVMGSVFIVATIFNKYFEAICFLISFFSLRYKFPKTYHSDSILICMICTISMFSLSIILCPPIYMYILVSILFGYLDCFILWFIKDRQDLIAYKTCSENFNIDTATKEQIIERCKFLHYKKDKIDLAVKFFVDKMSNKQVLEWLCKNNLNVEYDTVIQYRYRMLKDLRKFNKK